jgi:1,4-dihydroxy-2-naphthoate octaprenyltransferase
MSNRKHTFGEWMIAVRPWSFPASAMPVITATAYLFWKGAEINWLFALWALLNIVIFHAAGNTWSDYFDFRKKVDADDTFGAKTLTTGMFTENEIFRLSLGLTLVAAAGGVGLLLLTGLPLLWIGLGGIFCTLLYPFLKYNALGDLVILLAYAFLPTIGTAFVTTCAIDWSVLLLALPVGLITDGILHSNNTRDAMTDKRAGIKTMAMALGSKASAILYGFEVIFPFIWVGVLSIIGFFPLTTIIIFLTLVVAIGCAQTMMKSLNGDLKIIADLDVRTANLQLMFSALLTIAFVVAKFI